MLARCVAKDDAGKYFAVIDMLFEQQSDWVLQEYRSRPLKPIGKQAGLSEQEFEACLNDQALLDKIAADPEVRRRRAEGQFDAELLRQRRADEGRYRFEEFDKRIKPLLKS